MKKLFILFVCIFGFSAMGLKAQTNNNFEISKSLDIYLSLMKELNLNYVDEIQPAKLNETAIKAMLDDLDPYTVFIPESEIEDYQLMTTGEYGGIGSLIQQIGDFVYVSEPYEGFPAQKAGLIPGDCILEVSGVNAKGKTTQQISDLLKGQPGSSIDVKIKREGIDEPFVTSLTREKIKIDNIPYQTVFENGIAYIRLTGFTQKAAAEVKEVLVKMKETQQLKGLIIDLRSNGGGLLNEAVDITNLFVEKGELIVTTKGKTDDRTTIHRTRQAPVDLNIPMVVLVNESSASASEILAGALQDLDRAVIVGQRTFGKGLVQNVVPLVYNTQMKVTVAKYYIPSGRCIQEIDYSHKSENGGKIPDSLISTFKTRAGRIVHDGGGIEPDIALKPIEFSAVSANLYTGNYVFRFANQYAREHKSIESPQAFAIDDHTYQQFVDFVKNEKFTYTTESERIILKLKEIAESESYLDAVRPELELLEKEFAENKQNDILKYRSEIEEMLKVEIVTRYFYQKGKIISALQNDPELKKAFDVLLDQKQYKSILAGK
jgi:carboxyl-terminal processing protease